MFKKILCKTSCTKRELYMQVQKILINPTIKNHNSISEKSEKSVHKTSNPPSLSPVFANNILGYVQPLSFKGFDYQKTVDTNYFQLPKGAKPDIFQKAAAENLYLGNDVIVTAPTGTGKTAIAHYIITKNLEEGKKTFYTTPLKALSNEKFKDFQRTYGKNNVGLLTGDVKLNINAPVVLMTTEIYRNMVFGDNFKDKNKMLENLKTVVFDELHYLGDVDRGGIWEQSIILSDPKTQLLSLSATVGNKKDVATWMSELRPQDKLEIVALKNADDKYTADINAPKHTVLIDVPSENRHVELEINHLKAEAKSYNFRYVFSNSINNKDNKPKQLTVSYNIPPSMEAYVNIVQKLKQEDKLPAIIFVFSKKGCNAIMKYLSQFGPKLTTEEEQTEILEIISKYKSKGKYLGESLNFKTLLNGYAMHNSGLLPTQKELIEELFQKKLIKLVFATETLSAGINMPARTTIITSVRKPTETPDGADGKRFLTPNEFHQMAGRAGRRGIDKKGYCYALSVNDAQQEKFEELMQAPSNDLKSAFRPDYSFIAGYYDFTSDDDYIKQLFEKSFFAYNEDKNIRQTNAEQLLKLFYTRKGILRKMDFIKTDNTLTQKGKMLTGLNGYEQIPIINAIYNKDLQDFNALELAAIAGAFANIEPKAKEQEEGKTERQNAVFKTKNKKLEKFIYEFEKTLNDYNGTMKKLDKKFKKCAMNKDALNHINEWAEANYIYKDSRENWNRLYFGSSRDTIRDEGSMFKEITMTADLLRQMQKIAEIGETTSKTKDDIQYYKKLQTTLKEAENLISKEPIVDTLAVKNQYAL